MVFDCAVFVSDICILFVFRHGMYTVVTCPMSCNVTVWMQIYTNTNIKSATYLIAEYNCGRLESTPLVKLCTDASA